MLALAAGLSSASASRQRIYQGPDYPATFCPDCPAGIFRPLNGEAARGGVVSSPFFLICPPLALALLAPTKASPGRLPRPRAKLLLPHRSATSELPSPPWIYLFGGGRGLLKVESSSASSVFVRAVVAYLRDGKDQGPRRQVCCGSFLPWQALSFCSFLGQNFSAHFQILG